MKKSISLMLVLVYLASICAASAEIDLTPQNGMIFDEKSTSVYTNGTWSRTEEPHDSSIKNHLHISGMTRDGFNAEFFYNDSMLLADAGRLSTELTKASVCLAAAGYEKNTVNQMLAQMNFRIVGNYRFTDRSVEDNDHVAYTIGHKRIAGKDAYCVVIRGTCGDEEWFSNMNLGEVNNGNHEGFYKAADEVLADLYREADRNSIVWVTGHSRGAAVANIVAGRLTADWGGKHIFGYSYACPNVSKNVAAYENIHNFNNTGDLVSAIPLADSEWSSDSRPYGRYGVTHSWDFADDITAMGKSYHGAHDTAAYERILKRIVPSEQDYYSASSYFCMMAIAYFMQNNGSTSIIAFLGKYGSRWLNDFSSQYKNMTQTMNTRCQDDDGLDEELSQTAAKKALPEQKQGKTASACVMDLGGLTAANTLQAIQDAHSVSNYIIAINHE